MSTVLVHDTRLTGITPTALADVSILVDANSPINGLVGDILNASNITISSLLIMCHGSPGGLQLCLEGLRLQGMGVLAPLNGMVENIVLYSCSVAGRGGMSNVGERFCESMASVTGASVFAADVTQYYRSRHRLSAWDGSHLVSKLAPINFGGWEGNLYEFRPNASPIFIISNPVSEQHTY